MNGENGSVLILHDFNLERVRYELLIQRLERQDVTVCAVGNVDDAIDYVRERRPNLAIVSLQCGLGPQSTKGIDYSSSLRQAYEHLPIYADTKFVITPDSAMYKTLKEAKGKKITGWLPANGRPLDEQILDILDEIRLNDDEPTEADKTDEMVLAVKAN